MERWLWLYCRKGETVNAEHIRQVHEAELAARPGWISLDAYYASIRNGCGEVSERRSIIALARKSQR
jgi:hypothetical protein